MISNLKKELCCSTSSSACSVCMYYCVICSAQTADCLTRMVEWVALVFAHGPACCVPIVSYYYYGAHCEWQLHLCSVCVLLCNSWMSHTRIYTVLSLSSLHTAMRAVFSLFPAITPARTVKRKMAAPQHKSSVWDYFVKIDGNQVKCIKCNKKYAYHSSTTVMANHIKAKHVQARSSGQPSIEGYTVPPRHCDDVRAEKISVLIAKMIAEDTLPVCFVEGDGVT